MANTVVPNFFSRITNYL